MFLKLNADAQLYGFKYNHDRQHSTLIVIFSGIQFEVMSSQEQLSQDTSGLRPFCLIHRFVYSVR